MKSVLREPLVHFLVLGLLLFLFFAWKGGSSGAGRIVVSAGQLEHLAAGFTRASQRPPDGRELKALVDDYVKEELATREAVALGLDRDDAIIRRRLRQKLEFLVEDAAGQAPPTDADLQAWLAAHPGAFDLPPQVALRQVFVSPQRRGAKAKADADRLLARLRKGGADCDIRQLGDPTALPAELPLGPATEVNLTFGEGFARAVASLPPGGWEGPVESTYGLHLVLVRERLPAGRPELAAVRSLVEREVVAERRRQALDELYRGLAAKTAVVIEPPALPAAGAAR